MCTSKEGRKKGTDREKAKSKKKTSKKDKANFICTYKQTTDDVEEENAIHSAPLKARVDRSFPLEEASWPAEMRAVPTTAGCTPAERCNSAERTEPHQRRAAAPGTSLESPAPR
jgi:hypothetical protein